MSVEQVEDFGQTLTLHSLLNGIALERLGAALRGLLGDGASLIDDAGNRVVGSSSVDAPRQRAPLTILLKVLGYIEADASEDRLLAAAVLVEEALESSARYHMAMELHVHAVQADYDKLQEKHEALMESESRYRALSESLEQHVEEQVGTIEATQRRLYQAEKMVSVGRLGAGMAHEINNPIGFIKSNLVTAKSYVEKLASFVDHIRQSVDNEAVATACRTNGIEFVLEDFGSLVTESIDGADRITRIVAALKEFSNADGAEEEAADVNRIIRSVCGVLACQVQAHVKISLDAGALPPTQCRPGPLGQVFMNMLLNAAQSLGDTAGEIRIRTRLCGDEIRVHLTDNGAGIREADLVHIFDPFYTTRDVGEGTGLGLTVSRDIVQSHGGSIEVGSQVGTGTAFVIHLPVKE